MRGNVLIAGADNLLGTYLSALCITERDHVLYAMRPAAETCAAHIRAFVATLLGKTCENGPAETVRKQLYVCREDELQSGTCFMPVDEIWYLAGGDYFKPFARSEKMEWHLVEELVSRCKVAVRGSLNVVRPIAVEQSRGEDFARRANAEIANYLMRMGISCRFFRTAEIIGASPFSSFTDANGFVHFLAVLHDLKCEIDERQSKYFSFYALRSRAPQDGGVNLIHARWAANLMLRIARRNSVSGAEYGIGSTVDTPINRLYSRVGRAYGLNLLPVDNDGTLAAIDRLFAQRLAGYDPFLSSSRGLDWSRSYRAAEVSAEELDCGTEVLDTVLHDIQEFQESARERRVASAAVKHSNWERRTIDRCGFELVYFVAGLQGSPVIVLNALGQPLPYWYRLITILMRRHRIVLWEPRGTHAPVSAVGLMEQVEDVKAVVRNEEFAAAHIVAWCTGPKVAIEFYRQWPHAVASMVFLNTTLKSVHTPKELETAYERNLEILCGAAEAHPQLAEPILRTLRSGGESDGLETLDDDIERVAVDVLSSINADLKSCVLAPFRDEASIVSYAKQVLDFFNHDSVADAQRVQVPVLLVASEYDKVASPAMSRFAAKLLPLSQLVEVPGASHYWLYDRPEFAAEMIESFWASPTNLRPVQRSLRA